MANTLVEFIKSTAAQNYEEGGWDVIVECWSDSDIAEYILEVQATTHEQALEAFERIVGVWADRQADARNSAF
jgi:hypothetical protein